MEPILKIGSALDVLGEYSIESNTYDCLIWRNCSAGNYISANGGGTNDEVSLARKASQILQISTVHNLEVSYCVLFTGGATTDRVCALEPTTVPTTKAAARPAHRPQPELPPRPAQRLQPKPLPPRLAPARPAHRLRASRCPRPAPARPPRLPPPVYQPAPPLQPTPTALALRP